MFWLYNPQVLFSSNVIIPNDNMDYTEKLNTIARFALIFLVIIYIINGDMRWMSLSITLLVLTTILHKNVERFEKSNCTKPTVDNPYSNFTVNDYINNSNRPSSCDIKVEESIEKAQEGFTGILKDDVYKKNINFRDFYTLPVTTLVNDQNSFAKSLLGNSSGDCKHDGNNCLINQDTRFHKGRIFDSNI